MKIGLIDLEEKIFNTALMQISQYHKQKGDTVGWWSPLTDGQFDVVYCSSLFDFTDKSEVPKRAICGGTGYDVTSLLLKDMEACDLDYSIYPKCDKSFLWFSRGCVRNCPWCVVQQKEGGIRSVIPKNTNPKGEHIVVMDNNFFESGNWWPAICQLKYYQQPIDFQGINVRTITKGQCFALNTLKIHKQIKIAWDDPHEDMLPHLRRIIQLIKPYKLMCYVLIGYYDEPKHLARAFDLYRVRTLQRYGIDPFVMPYNKNDPYQKKFARYVNHKAIFNSVAWKDYR